MWKRFVPLLAVAGCADTTPFQHTSPTEPPLSPAAVSQADAALAGVKDDKAHDDIAASWALRFREQGKGQEAVEAASRIRDAGIRAAVLAEVQMEAGR